VGETKAQFFHILYFFARNFYSIFVLFFNRVGQMNERIFQLDACFVADN